jgi:hypothetical protein
MNNTKTCTFTPTLKCTAASPTSVAATFTYTDTPNTDSVSVVVNGTCPVAPLSSDNASVTLSATYGTPTTGAATATAFTITNNQSSATGALTVTTTGSTSITYSGCAGASLVKTTGTCLLVPTLTCKASDYGAVTGTATVTDPTSSAAVTVTVNGNCDPIKFVSSTLAMGNGVAGTPITSAAQTIDNLSTAHATGTLGAPTISNAVFTVTSDNCAAHSIAASPGSCTTAVKMSCTAATLGPQSGTITYTDPTSGLSAALNVSGSCGAIAIYPCSEGTGTTTADSTGNGHTGTLSGASWSSPGIAVTGSTSSYVTASGFNELGSNSTSLTLMTWVYPLATTSSGTLFHPSQTNAGAGWCFPYIGFDGTGKLVTQILYGASSSSVTAVSGPTLPAKQWSHVAMTINAATGTVTMFVNGVQQGTATNGSYYTSGASMYDFWGSDGPSGSSCWHGNISSGAFDGVLDDMEMYGSVLSTAEIASRAATPPATPTPPGAIASYPLTEGSGTTTADSTGDGHTGTLVSTTWAAPGVTTAGSTSSYVTASGFTDLGDQTKSFTLATWINPATSSPRGELFHPSSGSSGLGWCFPYLGFNSSGNLVAQVLYGASSSSVTGVTGPTVSTGTWTHVAETFDVSTGTVTLYVNGVSQGTATNGTYYASGSSMYVFWGSDGPSGDSCWHGSITTGGFNGTFDKMVVYNYALSASQVAELTWSGN